MSLESLLKKEREVRYTYKCDLGYFECLKSLAIDLVSSKKTEKFRKKFQTLFYSSICIRKFQNLFFEYISTGPAAEPSGRFPPLLLAGGGDGDPPCALASRRWGPIYIASYTHTLGSWDDFL
jgi:hypothetical protein